MPEIQDHRRRCTALLVSSILWLLAGAATATDDDGWPAWAEEEERLRAQIAAVNEGSLAFLGDPPAQIVHHHAGRVAITSQSLVDGWVRLEQCHVNLDRVAAAQILFHPSRSRALHVTRFRNIDEVFVDGNSVQLRNVEADSEVCLTVESRALHAVDGGVFELQNGPFMRRFLDGYYPLRVSLRIDYPEALVLADHQPSVQPGFDVESRPGQLHVEALFEGRLQTVFRFLER